MPRTPRIKGNSKIYHIIIRGINKQIIFLKKEDYKKFIKQIQKAKEKYQYELYAFALMDNHVHLVIKDNMENLSQIMQSINVSYSLYFNKKYERTGHLFENRFKSKAVETQSYLKNLIRYIHQNPIKAGYSLEYPWTSYGHYFFSSTLIKNSFILSLFGDNQKECLENFEKFHQIQENDKDKIAEYELLKDMVTDEVVIIKIQEIIHTENIVEIQNYDRNTKREVIQKILKIEGVTKTQIARVLGITRQQIYRLIEK